MKFIYGRQDFKTMERGEENCYLMTNGLGGFSSLTMAGSCTRNDHALLMSCFAAEAPNHRYNMIHSFWGEQDPSFHPGFYGSFRKGGRVSFFILLYL